MTHKTARATYSLGFVVPTARFSTKVRLKFWTSGDDVGFGLAARNYCVNVDVEEHSAWAHDRRHKSRGWIGSQTKILTKGISVRRIVKRRIYQANIGFRTDYWPTCIWWRCQKFMVANLLWVVRSVLGCAWTILDLSYLSTYGYFPM